MLELYIYFQDLNCELREPFWHESRASTYLHFGVGIEKQATESSQNFPCDGIIVILEQIKERGYKALGCVEVLDSLDRLHFPLPLARHLPPVGRYLDDQVVQHGAQHLKTLHVNVLETFTALPFRQVPVRTEKITESREEWDVIACPCPWYLLLIPTSSYIPHNMLLCFKPVRCMLKKSDISSWELHKIICTSYNINSPPKPFHNLVLMRLLELVIVWKRYPV